MNQIKITESIPESEISITIPFGNSTYKFTGKTFLSAAKAANQFARGKGIGILRKLEEAIAEYTTMKRRTNESK